MMSKTYELILEDEPTGSLVRENKMKALGLLKGLRREGKTVVFATCDEDLIHLRDPLTQFE